MAIKLQKGEGINLSKNLPALVNVHVGLGWNEPEKKRGDYEHDLDVSAFLLTTKNGSPVMVSEGHFVFYNNLRSPCNGVRHTGDDRSGAASINGEDEDNEVIEVHLDKLTRDITEISFVVTIHDAVKRKQNFGQISNAYIVLKDLDSGAEICRYMLTEEFTTETAVQIGSLFKKGNDWSFEAIGAGYNRGLEDFIKVYGYKAS